MLKVTWRNLVARKLRLALSAFAIVLGVAFVAGSFIFTDAMGGAFSGIIKGTTADVEIAPKGANDFDSLQDRRTIPADVADKLEKLPEAQSVHPYSQQQGVYVIDPDGDLVGGNGPPGLAFSYGDTVSITGDRILTLTEGELPSGADEVALEQSTAEKAGYEIGDDLELVTAGQSPTMRATMTGLMRFGSEGGVAGATIVVFSPQAMQELFFEGRNVYSGISLTAAGGVSQQELRDAAQPLLPPDVEARTGDMMVDANEAGIQEILGFINTFLLVFAGVSLVVGTFLIINTFSILVAQRSRELALLRAMGASKRQVNRSVLVEAFAVGVFGSTLGIGTGYLLALGLRALFGFFGLDLGEASFPVTMRTVVVSYAVGLVVTMVAAYLPARRGSRVAPVAAMRDEVALSESSLRRRMIVGGVMVFVGVALMVLGFAGEGTSGLALIGAGMLSILIGVALMAPVLGRPVIHGLGAAYRKMFGTVGVLATQNSLRNPRRTAATASALMIGLTLVALMSILGQSASASTDKAINEALTSEYIVSNVVGAPFSPQIAGQIRDLSEVETVAQFRSANAKVDGDTAYVGAVDPADLAQTFRLPTLGDVTSSLRPGTVLAEQQTAERAGFEVGDAIAMRFQGGKVELTLAGTFPPGSLPAGYLVTPDTLRQGGLEPLDSMLFITKAPGAADGDLRAAVDEITSKLPTVTLKDPQEFADEQKAQINIFLYLVYALLGLAIIIAVLGIVNTLALSVIERTREVGLLRAVGLSRRQLRRMVRLESVAIAVLGAVLGVVMGVVFGVALQRAIADQGLDVLSIPWLLLVIFVVVAAVVGVLAAVLPARRAAKLNVLTAITTE